MVKHFVALGMVGMLLSGCAALVAGAAVGVGAVATDDRPVRTQFDDAGMRAAINKKFLAASTPDLFSNINVNVTNGKVLLAGKVRTQQSKDEAERLAREVRDVVEVNNEIRIEDPNSIWDNTHDGWIQTQIRSKLIATKNIHSNHFTVEVVDGVAYVMGDATSQQEMDSVLDIVRRADGITKVISYVTVK